MAIKLEGINYIYGQGTEMVVHALKNINLEIKDGEFVGLIGHTGSGKSTLLHLIGGVDKPTSGHIFVDGQDVYKKNKETNDKRRKKKK